MNDLFGGKFSPVTNTIGFLRCDHLRAAEAFLDWQENIQRSRGVSLEKAEIHGDFQSAILKLFPLTSVERRRYLFIPTRSDWTAFLDNGHQGTDAFSPLSYLAGRLSCEGVRATCVLDGQKDRYPAVILEIYGPERTEFLNYVRSIAVAYDGKKWSFAASGSTQPFEQVEKYSSRYIQDRFRPEMLSDYLKALGIRAFEEDFYLPESQEAMLIEKHGPIASAAREFRLADIQ